MEIKSLSPKYIFKKSFLLTKDIYHQLLLLCIPNFLIILLWIHKPNPLLVLASFITFTYFTLASTVYILGKVNGYSKSIYEALVEARNLFPKVLLWFILILLIIIPAFAVLIIPGVYLSCRFIFSFFLIAEENFPIIESLKYSWKTTNNNFNKIIQNGLIIFFFYSLLVFLLSTNLWYLGKAFFLLSLLTCTIPFLLVYWTLVFKGINSLELRVYNNTNALKDLEIESIQIEFDGSLNEKDISRFMWTIQSRLLWIALIPLGLLFGSFLLPIITSAEGVTSETITQLISTMLVPTLLLIVLFVVIRTSSRRVLKSSKGLTQVSGCVHEKGLQVNSLHIKTKYSWKAFESYRDFDDLVMLYIATNQAVILPERYFENKDDWEKFKLIVTSKIAKKLS